MKLSEFIDVFSSYSTREKDELENLFLTYLSELQRVNKFINLTAIDDTESVVEKHFYDSALALQYFNIKNKKILDVGTGAGFPGLVLAILCPESEVTLLDSNNKKIIFLNDLILKLKLKNVKTVLGRIEENSALNENFDFVCNRAVSALRILLEICSAPLKINGHMICYKSLKFEEEIEEAKNAFSVLNLKLISTKKVELPTNKDTRILLDIIKEKSAPKKYPRRFSQILKKPL